MASGAVSFIDIAVLEDVRARFAAGDALAILSIDLEEVIWANGPGAALLGYPDIETVMGASPGLTLAARRQIEATPGFPRIGRNRPVAVRLASGTGSRLVPFLASGITLPDGTPVILLAEPAKVSTSLDESEAAARAIQGFGEAGYFAAMLDASGRLSASSPGFGELGISPATLETLVADVAQERDRLVKRLIPARGGMIPAGLARLTDEPATHLLITAQTPVETEAEIPAPAQEAAAAPVEPVSESEPADDLPLPSDADLPDLVAEAAPAPEAPRLEAAAPGEPDDWYFAGDKQGAEPDAEADDTVSSSPAPAPAKPDPVRFVWRTDANDAFSSISDEFVQAVGPEAANVIGRPFGEVSEQLALDPSGEIIKLLQRRDTWSGRTVLWPIAGTDRAAPVDLAALPVYNRDRVFEGFRGFGVVRIGDAVEDPAARGLKLRPPAFEVPQTAEEEPPAESEQPAVTADAAPEETAAPPVGKTNDNKVIRLAEHRSQQRHERRLSPSDRSAFEEIRARLQQDFLASEAEKKAEQEAAKEAEASAEEPEAGAIAELPEEIRLETSAPQEEHTEPVNHVTEMDGGSDAEVTEEPQSPEHADEPVEAENAEEPAETVRAEEPAQPALEPVRPQPVEAETPTPPTLQGLMPSAFARSGGRPSVDPELIAGLPIPLLIHAGDELYFANREFLSLTGYASLDQIRREGGLDRLFVDCNGEEREGHAGRVTVRTLGGEEIPVDAHLQSVRWYGRSALLLSLRRKEPEQVIVQQPEPVRTAELLQEDIDRDVAMLRTIIDTATDGVVLINPDATIRSISKPAEALFGFDSAQVEGKPFHTLFAIESRKAAQDYLAGLYGNGVASILNDGREVIGREAQGRFIPLFMTIGKLPEDSGYCAVLRDITQWKRAEEQLTQARAQAERASSQKTEFLARVSHEIRTPLNAIIGFSELMMDEKFGPIGSDRYRDYLRDINRSGNHVLDLVNDLLDISKIEAGEQEMHYEAVSLNDSLAETVAMMQPQANRERVIIRSSLASNLPEVVADLRSVRQIALNLLSNAIRYTQAGGQVIVSTSYEPSGDVVMRVRDTGIGMTLAEIDQALKPFKQINALKRGRRDGTGLGLPLTKAMVEANRARFSITSTPGEGTMVEVVFPSTRVLAE
ncbi:MULTISPECIES: histidine kinase dimerization/phospho-acceptor domain-containing protein [unclassified Aminobacter]|uniref:histidine kinase dimerization/phospho-acceptor domain-containing protein n=1 Tax=unclassified Aminobacter TaxID=2644704 RepID=UPI0004676A4B|nr:MULTISPECIES: histidine kinase dimerization/phospho-acceptor domain-containing protein [unclassified Aminobacter]TWH34071.1 PAS domain S-box-containing protein [Aminobacter sp. J15]